jgi:hypothetical protein
MTVLTVNNPPAATHGETVRCLFLCRPRNYAASRSVSPASTALGRRSVRHSFGHLQVLEELKQFVRRLKSARNGIKWHHPGQRCLLKCEVGVQVDLRGLG